MNELPLSQGPGLEKRGANAARDEGGGTTEVEGDTERVEWVYLSDRGGRVGRG